MLIGERIKKLREVQGLSQGKLARAAAISNDYMHKIENGKVTNIGIEVIDSIAQALDTHPSTLLYGKILSPKIKLNTSDDIGPLSEQEKALILNFRMARSDMERKTIQDVAKQFAK